MGGCRDFYLQARLLPAIHASPVGGHSGIPVTPHCAKRLSVWRSFKASVKEFVPSCPVC